MKFFIALVVIIALPFTRGQACSIFPGDSVFNTPIDTLPVDVNSDSYVASIGSSTHLHPDFGAGKYQGNLIGIPFNNVKGTTTKSKVKFQYKSQSDKGPYPIPKKPKIEAGSDRHLLMLDKGNCILYELYSATKLKTPKNGFTWKAGSGAIFDLNSNTLRPIDWTSADAAGLPIFPLLVRRSEVAAGVINHALRFTASTTRDEYVWPARHQAGSTTNQNVPPMGQRFRLKASFDISGFSPDTQVILTAMKKYGMFLADNGSNWYISGEPNGGWNNDELVSEFSLLKGSDFEAVDESSLIIDPNSGQVAVTNSTA